MAMPVRATPFIPPGRVLVTNTGVCLRYGSPVGVEAVESELAMFSAMTRMRDCCARRAEAATAMAASAGPRISAI